MNRSGGSETCLMGGWFPWGIVRTHFYMSVHQFLHCTLPRLLILSVWIHHLIDISVYWAFQSYKSCCTELPHGSWLLKGPGLPAVPMLGNHTGCENISVTANVQLVTPCRVCLMHGSVWCRVCPDCAQHMQGMLVFAGRGYISAACIMKFQLETSQALSSPPFPEVTERTH